MKNDEEGDDLIDTLSKDNIHDVSRNIFWAQCVARTSLEEALLATMRVNVDKLL